MPMPVLPVLSEKRAVDPALVNGVAAADLTTKAEQTVSVTFLNENAGFLNTLVAYTIATDGTLGAARVVFENVDGPDRGGGPLSGGETIEVGSYAAGTQLGFALLQDAASKGIDLSSGTLEFRAANGGPATISDAAPPELYLVASDGSETKIDVPIFHTADGSPSDAATNALNPAGAEHTISAVDDDGNVVIAFEDVVSTAKNFDGDYNDAVFEVEFSDDFPGLPPPDTLPPVPEPPDLIPNISEPEEDWVPDTPIVDTSEEVVDSAIITTVISYDWYAGCGPTAVANILAHWDLQGYGDLFTADGRPALQDRGNVQDEIASPEHLAKFAPDQDENATLPDDVTTLADPLNSIADFYQTSKDDVRWTEAEGGDGTVLKPLPYGWSYNFLSDNAFEGYASSRGYDFKAENSLFDEFSFDKLKAEIDASRPLLAYVDSSSLIDNRWEPNNADGTPDHFVPIAGYEDRGDDGQFYYYYSNWAKDEGRLRSAKWQSVNADEAWGVASVTTIKPISKPDVLALNEILDIDGDVFLPAGNDAPETSSGAAMPSTSGDLRTVWGLADAPSPQSTAVDLGSLVADSEVIAA